MATIGEKKCGCKRHNEYSNDAEYEATLHKLSHKKIKASVIHEMEKLHCIDKKTTYVCESCVQHVAENIDDDISVHNVIENIKNRKYKSEDLKDIASELGKSIRFEVKTEAEKMSADYKDVKNLASFEKRTYFFSKNELLVTFLLGVTGMNITSVEESALTYLVIAIDCIYAAAHPRCITLLCFMISFFSYVMSGSKTICKIISSIIPSGCYSTLLNWMKSQASTSSPKPPSEVDIFTYFDNNQIISRNWSIHYDAKALVSVITTSIQLIPPVPSFVLKNPSLSPASWFFNQQFNPTETAAKIREFILFHDNVFNSYRNVFIQILLDSTQQEITSGCNTNFDIAECFGVVSKHIGKTSVVTCDPIFLNPCSYKSIHDILSTLQDSICDGTRSWSIIGCDGLPYVLGSRLLENDSSLQDILLVPGLGHFEINMTKSCFKLLWEVILQDVAKCMGYRTIKALAACQKCSDHHKAWQLLSVSFKAVTKEIATMFIAHSVETNTEVTVNNFYAFMKELSNPNLIFLCHSFLTYVFALMLFRAGERYGDKDVILSSRTKFSSLFFGLNQTFYQEISMRDIHARVRMPTPVSDLINQYETFTVSGSKSKGEGGDFVLEARNRRIKRMMPPGHPNNDTWERVCKNADTTDKVIT